MTASPAPKRPWPRNLRSSAARAGRRACGPARSQARAAHRLGVKRVFYRLADERRAIILVACSKCDWRAAFRRDQLIASHGADYAIPTYSTISPHQVAAG
jgi:hypothetical protein